MFVGHWVLLQGPHFSPFFYNSVIGTEACLNFLPRLERIDRIDHLPVLLLGGCVDVFGRLVNAISDGSIRFDKLDASTIWVFFSLNFCWKRNITFLQRYSSLNFWVNILCNCAIAVRIRDKEQLVWSFRLIDLFIPEAGIVTFQRYMTHFQYRRKSRTDLIHFDSVIPLNSQPLSFHLWVEFFKVEIWVALGRKLLLVTNIALCLLNMLDAILSLVSPTWPLCTVSL